ncbi:MAG: sugar phosphate isomerase/epimerase [Planctomycetia bacterium]|nr:sugar phosphate isomerase/epimerase [Planctomycetia bacterium]
MGNVKIGMNLEATRHHDKPFVWGLDRAAEMGYEYVEPMVHFGRELMSEAGYYHTWSLFDDPMKMRRLCEDRGLKISGLQAHGPLGCPDRHAEYLKMAIRFAAECGAPVVNTDEGIKSPWTTEAEDWVLMKYTLQEAAFVAEARGVKIGLECHAQYSKTPAGLEKLYALVKSPAMGFNLDTGNAYLAGQDPYSWLESIIDRSVHMHAKDISVQHSNEELGKVTGTPVGCGCGDGVLDWTRLVKIAMTCPHDIVFSVECGSIDEAKRSLEHLSKVVKECEAAH